MPTRAPRRASDLLRDADGNLSLDWVLRLLLLLLLGGALSPHLAASGEREPVRAPPATQDPNAHRLA